MTDKPKTIEEYKKWITDIEPNISLKKEEIYYKNVMTTAKEQFVNSSFWKEIIDNWNNINISYYMKTGYDLFGENKKEIFIKPFDSVIDKTFRKNVLNNSSWPNPSIKYGCWILPKNCQNMLNDCLRTTIIVKYLDGVEFILKELERVSCNYGLECRYDYEAKDQGYYAVHFYICNEFEVPSEIWDTKKIKINVEIQITTQIQDTIKKLTHRYYDSRRSLITNKNIVWQWNYKSDEFVVNYLGHLLHYLEGMIMEIREKNKE